MCGLWLSSGVHSFWVLFVVVFWWKWYLNDVSRHTHTHAGVTPNLQSYVFTKVRKEARNVVVDEGVDERFVAFVCSSFLV